MIDIQISKFNNLGFNHHAISNKLQIWELFAFVSQIWSLFTPEN